MSIGVLGVIIAVITISVTVWMKRKKLMTTTDNVARGVNSREMQLSENVAYFETTVSGADTNEVHIYDYVSTINSKEMELSDNVAYHVTTNTRNDITIGTSPNEAYGATVAGDLAKK